MYGLFDFAVQLFCITALFALFVFFLVIITDLAYDLAARGGCGEPTPVPDSAASSATSPAPRSLSSRTIRQDSPAGAGM